MQLDNNMYTMLYIENTTIDKHCKRIIKCSRDRSYTAFSRGIPLWNIPLVTCVFFVYTLTWRLMCILKLKLMKFIFYHTSFILLASLVKKKSSRQDHRSLKILKLILPFHTCRFLKLSEEVKEKCWNCCPITRLRPVCLNIAWQHMFQWESDVSPSSVRLRSVS